ncbi:MAG: hypothetical protein F6K19_38455 [Cyanothece sp. SIO1E1]|nr:hypothetical protein [Cyanothece sp. SIO1E1]
MMNDLELIETFILNSIEDKESLVANRNLRTESTFGVGQLISQKEGVLINTHSNNKIPHFLVRARSSYWQMMNQTLANHHFLVKGNLWGQDFYPYHHFKLPQNYQLNCTKARNLWRVWRLHTKQQARNLVNLKDFMVRSKAGWHTIQTMVMSNEILYISTVAGEVSMLMTDLLFWLNRAGVEKSILVLS